MKNVKGLLVLPSTRCYFILFGGGVFISSLELFLLVYSPVMELIVFCRFGYYILNAMKIYYFLDVGLSRLIKKCILSHSLGQYT